jgi:hypothetical protein
MNLREVSSVEDIGQIGEEDIDFDLSFNDLEFYTINNVNCKNANNNEKDDENEDNRVNFLFLLST